MTLSYHPPTDSSRSSHPLNDNSSHSYHPLADNCATQASQPRGGFLLFCCMTFAVGLGLSLGRCCSVSIANSLSHGSVPYVQLRSGDQGRFVRKHNADNPDPPPDYLSGWSQSRWISCTTDLGPCPLHQLNAPHEGCSSKIFFGQVLLTADGLSSPHLEMAFQHVLESAVNARGPGHDLEDKRVLLVLDATYEAYDARISCEMRKNELTSLGASSVICIILDPQAREDLWKHGQAVGGPSKAFGNAMHNLTDDYIFEELNRAIAIFVDYGSSLLLTQSFRRKLNLTHSGKNAPALSMRDYVRARMHDISGGLAYVGVSTGSSLAGEIMIDMPDHAVEDLDGDQSGLGLIPNCSFFPHLTAKDTALTFNLSQRFHTGVMAIPNCQPIVNIGTPPGHLRHMCA